MSALSGKLLPPLWSSRLEPLDYAFQPIVGIRTGRILGFEALLRGVDKAGFETPAQVFNAAYDAGCLVEVESRLRQRALEKFGRRPDAVSDAMLFLNIDVRLFTHTHYDASLMRGMLPRGRTSAAGICLELAEGNELTLAGHAAQVFEQYRRNGFCVAVDDFGVGFAGLKLLYDTNPDFIKIDRFFISGIDQDVRKRGLVEQVVRYAHIRGTQVVAEGVETDAEFYVCRDLGCDFVQGYRIARPSLLLDDMQSRYEEVSRLNNQDRRRRDLPITIAAEVMEAVDPLPATLKRAELLDIFRREDAPNIVPVLDDRHRPLGVVRERELKPYAYSRFGGELLRNKGIGDTIREFIRACPVCDIETRVDRIVEAFSGDGGADGIILTDEGRYVGFLSPRSLLKLVHEFNLAAASDQNPLTRLPGNHRIERHLEQLVEDKERTVTLVYFDFDNFKPFNDTYGFRQGDRAILMFADMLRATAQVHGGFAGHIGGDDFFYAVCGQAAETTLAYLRDLSGRFRSEARSFYEPEVRERGYIRAKDRFGQERDFPLLSVSGVVVVLPPGQNRPGVDEFGEMAAGLKVKAKYAPDHLHVEILQTTAFAFG